ncbi:MAG: hypothetical protein P0Y59_11600 [Candidatus Sphingomonas phytovorans]|nr:hypothetical protein [Sphingomonas sp.]WEK02291.1 MAG: hypothetical protein P0Y59_11600 [Sphingomonas sp.]
MLHHLSISVDQPDRVARVLAEVMEGDFRPFPPNAGSFFVFQKDDFGTMIEIHKTGTILVPEGSGFEQVVPRAPDYAPTHFAMSVRRPRDEIQAIADREGWLCRRNDRAEFPVMEFWIENMRMCEFLPPDFAAAYLEIARGGGRRGPPPGAQ